MAKKKSPSKKRTKAKRSDKVVELTRHAEWSISQFALNTGFQREAIRKCFADAGVKPCGKRGGYPIYRPIDGLPALYQSSEGQVDPDKLKPFERHAYYKAEREKLHLQIERRDVVPMIEVEQLYGRRNKQVVQNVDTLVDVLERDVGLTPAQAARIEKHVDQLRELLFRLSNEDADSADRHSA